MGTPGCNLTATENTVALPDANPKTRHGATKVPMQLIPATALAIEATAFRDGSIKYGPYNWRDEPVSASIYIAAAMRHIQQWYNGEELAADSGVHHLGHARACLAILLDAQFALSLNDDRPAPVDLSALLEGLTVPIRD